MNCCTRKSVVTLAPPSSPQHASKQTHSLPHDRRNELVYNMTKEVWPDAWPIFYDWGAAYYTPQGCSHGTSRPDKCVNLSPAVPQGWDMELHATFNESFVKSHPFTVSLYSVDDVVL